MTMIRPLAALFLAAAAGACAAGSHNAPDADERVAAGRDSLVTGSAIAATMPFPGTVYPNPPSHRARRAGEAAAHAGDQATPAAAAPDTAAADTAATAIPTQPAAAQPTATQPTATQPVTPQPAAPAEPAAIADEHAGHDGNH